MSSTTENDADRKEIFEALLEHRKVDPEVAKRVLEQSQALQRKYRRNLDAVAVIRSIRDE